MWREVAKEGRAECADQIQAGHDTKLHGLVLKGEPLPEVAGAMRAHQLFAEGDTKMTRWNGTQNDFRLDGIARLLSAVTANKPRREPQLSKLSPVRELPLRKSL